MRSTTEELEFQQMLDAVRSFLFEHSWQKNIKPGEDYITPARQMSGIDEIMNLIEVGLSHCYASGKFTQAFEQSFKRMHRRRFGIAVNSGSSANLLAISALTSKQALGEKRFQKGENIIVTAAGFPTTVTAVLHNGLKPNYIDVDMGTYVPTLEMIEAAIDKKTRAIFLAHTLGNPIPLDGVLALCKKHGLMLIEDNCDAIGSLYKGKLTGRFGAMATQSFYPAHHISTGEGGMILTDNALLRTAIESFRDWGRSCWCPPGKDNTCGKRFDGQYGDLPAGYDHKYVYTHWGYNLKFTDLQAAIGLAQFDRLDYFIQERIKNFDYLLAGLQEYEEHLILPKAQEHSIPSWFGFPITMRNMPSVKIEQFLEEKKIGTRKLFGGDLTQQPAFMHAPAIKSPAITKRNGNTNKIMKSTFWIGLWPGMTEQIMNYMIESIGIYCKQKGVAG